MKVSPGTLRELAAIAAGVALIARGIVNDPVEATLVAMGVGLLGVTPAIGGRGKDSGR